MKKTLVVAAGLAVLSTSAFASKARMSALSQGDVLGSYYMDDNRNIWRMPHQVNTHNNFVITEWAGGESDGATAQAEGGFFRSSASMNYGLYLNAGGVSNNISLTDTVVVDPNEDDDESDNFTIAAGDPSRVDLFISGSGSMEWGARLGYSSFSKGDEEGTALDLTVSAVLGGANVWLGFAPSATSTRFSEDNDNDGDATTTVADSTPTDTEFNSDMRLGFTYGVADHTLFAEYSSEGGAGDDVDAQTQIVVGMGKTMAAGDNATVFYDVQVQSTSNVGFNEDVSLMRVPVRFGAEVRANSWLTWRASISQSIFGALDTDGDKTSVRTTALGAGASLTWGDLQLDGTLTSAAAGNLGTDSNLMSNVSATYSF